MHIGFDPGDDPFSSLEATARSIRKCSPQPEPLRVSRAHSWLAHKGHDEGTKVTIWSRYNLSRYQFSDDLAFSRGRPNLWAAQWGWETGSQGLLQRLHKQSQDRFTLLQNRRNTQGSDAELRTARAYALSATEQFCTLGLDVEKPKGDGFFDQARHLAELTKPNSVRWSDIEIGVSDSFNAR